MSSTGEVVGSQMNRKGEGLWGDSEGGLWSPWQGLTANKRRTGPWTDVAPKRTVLQAEARCEPGCGARTQPAGRARWHAGPQQAGSEGGGGAELFHRFRWTDPTLAEEQGMKL